MMNEKSHKYTIEARDTGGRGLTFNRFLIEFGLAKDIGEANSLIRAGAVDVNDKKIKDILHLLTKGTYEVKIHGNLVAQATIL